MAITQNHCHLTKPHVRECKTVLDSGFHVVDSGFQVLNFGFFVSGTGIPDCNRKGDSGFLELYSGLHEHRIPDSTNKISRIPDFTSKYIQNCRIRIPLHEVKLLIFASKRDA